MVMGFIKAPCKYCGKQINAMNREQHEETCKKKTEKMEDFFEKLATRSKINKLLPEGYEVEHDAVMRLMGPRGGREWCVVFGEVLGSHSINREDVRIFIRALRKATKKDWYADTVSNYIFHLGTKCHYGTNVQSLSEFQDWEKYLKELAARLDPEFKEEKVEELLDELLRKDARKTEGRDHYIMVSTYKRWKKQRSIFSFE